MSRAVFVLWVVAAASRPLAAQGMSILVAGAHARYADSITGTAGLASARLVGSSPSAAGFLEGTFSQFVTGEWTVQLSGYGTALARWGDVVGLGFAAGGTLSNFEAGTWAGTGGGGPVVTALVGGTLLSAGLSVGGLRRVDRTASGLVTGNVRVRQALGGVGTVEIGAAGLSTDTLRYADVTGGFTFESPAVRLAVTGGVRSGDLDGDPWGGVRVEWTVVPAVTLEASGGRYPADPAGFTDGAYATMGIRLNLVRERRPAVIRPVRDAVVARREGPGRVRVVVRYERPVNRLEIVGDWTDWAPVPLEPEGAGRWSVVIDLPPGVHKFALLVDGDRWVVPEGVAWVPDDFGGRLGLLAVP